MRKNSIYMTIPRLFTAGLFLIIGSINIYSQCAYDYLCKAYSAPRAVKTVYCDSSIMVDSTYIPAYVYKLKTMWFPPIYGHPKPVDTADSSYKAGRIRKLEESKVIVDKAWQIDSQYFNIYEFKLIIYGWKNIDTGLYKKLKGEIKFKKDLKFNDSDLKCRPYDRELFWNRAHIFFELGMYDSALIWADKAYSFWPDSVLKLKRNIFAKTNNKPGIKHVMNEMNSFNWQKEYLWINTVENEILKTSDDCCVRLYCLAIERTYKESQFNDLKSRCKKIMKKYRHLKPFDNRDCHVHYGNCHNYSDYY